MGCNTCNQQNSKSDVDLVTESLTNSKGRDHLLLKIGAFVGVVCALPIIIIALVFQVFMQFFYLRHSLKLIRSLEMDSKTSLNFLLP